MAESTTEGASVVSPSGVPPSPPFPQTEMEECVAGKIWFKLYYIRVAGATFTARTTVVKLGNGKLWIHSPGGPLDDQFKTELDKIGGEVGYLVAPGDFHHLKLPEWQLSYPNAKTYVCPGLDTKRKDLTFHSILTDGPEDEWNNEFEQVVIRGRLMSEVLFLHKATQTLIVTDLVQFVTDEAMSKDGTGGGWGTWFWVNVLRMKNRVLPAPEYRLAGFTDKEGVKNKLEKVITEWNPQRVIISHGENMTQGQESIEKMLRSCWAGIISAPPAPASPPTTNDTPAQPQ